MNTKRFVLIALIILLAFVLAQSALAMSSAHFRLDWFVPLEGSGSPASSAHFAANITVGQAVFGASSSTHLQTGLGYWYGVGAPYSIYLPLILRN
ncbi:hypothetical protein TFLX_05432 [Thermoflexales bacterium]|nr:hypothetical protein TFLX_05432 [Thermoflexales bacterium]